MTAQPTTGAAKAPVGATKEVTKGAVDGPAPTTKAEAAYRARSEAGRPLAESVAGKASATRRRQHLEARLGLPERPAKAVRAELGDWPARAACAGAPDSGLTEATRQGEVVDLVETYCARCPVVAECLAEGRAAHGSGLYGGIVLDDGHLARDRHLSDDCFRVADAWSATPAVAALEADDADEGEAEGDEAVDSPPPARLPGQRWQLRRPRSRRARRRRNGSASSPMARAPRTAVGGAVDSVEHEPIQGDGPMTVQTLTRNEAEAERTSLLARLQRKQGTTDRETLRDMSLSGEMTLDEVDDVERVRTLDYLLDEE